MLCGEIGKQFTGIQRDMDVVLDDERMWLVTLDEQPKRTDMAEQAADFTRGQVMRREVVGRQVLQRDGPRVIRPLTGEPRD